MSNLLELLTKINRKKEIKKSVSPQIIMNTKSSNTSRKKIFIIFIIALVIIGIGILIVEILQSSTYISDKVADKPDESFQSKMFPRNMDSSAEINYYSRTDTMHKAFLESERETLETNDTEMPEEASSFFQEEMEQEERNKRMNEQQQEIKKETTNSSDLKENMLFFSLQKSKEQKILDKTLYIYRGKAYEKRKDIRSAIAEYKKALVIDSNDYKVLNKIGALYIKLEDWDRAIEYLKTALKIRSDYIQAIVNLSISLEMKGKSKKAEDMLQKAYTMQPFNPYINYNLALFYERHNKIDMAFKYYKSATTLSTDNIKFMALLGIARIREKVGLLKKAAFIYKELLINKDTPNQLKILAGERLNLITQQLR